MFLTGKYSVFVRIYPKFLIIKVMWAPESKAFVLMRDQEQMGLATATVVGAAVGLWTELHDYGELVSRWQLFHENEQMLGC